MRKMSFSKIVLIYIILQLLVEYTYGDCTYYTIYDEVTKERSPPLNASDLKAHY